MSEATSTEPPRASLGTNDTAPDRRVHFRCPGCDDVHGVTIDAGPVVWGWNGDLVRPTFTPSVLVRAIQWDTETYPRATFKKRAERHPGVAVGQHTVCHSFVRDGRIEYLGDCTHNLAGQTVDLPAWESES